MKAMRPFEKLGVCLLVSSALWLGAPALAAEVLELQVGFPEPSLQVDERGYTHVSLPGAPNLARPGAPALPVRLVRVALPPGARVRAVEVTPLGQRALPGFHEVFPAQPPRPLSLPAADFLPPDPEAYRAPGLFPASPSEARPVQGLRGVAVLPLAVWPVRAEPLAGALWFTPAVRVRIELEAGKAQAPTYRGLAEDLARAERLVENPELLGRYPAARGRAPGDARYVVVTSAALVGCPGDYGLEALLAEKQLRGLTTRLETVEAIRAAYPGRDDAEKIRAFLRERYLEDGAEFALLAGDADGAQVGGETEPVGVPVRMLWGDIGFGPDDVPSDLYYSCLDGDLDGNGNDVFGEAGDAPDLMAELDVGRAPVDSCQEVASFVQKTLAYQATQAAYLQRVAFAGEWLWDGYGDYDWAKTFLEQIHHSGDELLPTLGFDQSAFFQVSTMYDRDLGGADSWGAAEMLALLNGNPHLVNHLGHSYTNYALRLTTDQLMAGIANSLPFLVYTQGCYPGAFDNRLSEYDDKAHQPQDSFVEHMLLDPLGAFAAVMNTRYGLGWTSNYYHRTFWDALFRVGERHLGAMQSYSRDALAGFVPGDDGMRWIHYDANLFGDPEVELKTSASSEPLLGVPARPIRLVEVIGGGAPQGGKLLVRNDGLGALTFEVQSSEAWLTVTPAGGEAPAELDLGLDLTGLGPGLLTAALTVTSPEAANSPQVVQVELELVELPAPVVPFLAGEAPSVDGRLERGEWSQGASLELDPSRPGQRLLLAHDGQRLYLALDLPADTSEEDYDTWMISLDADGDLAWPQAAADDGMYYAYAYPGERYFSSIFDPGSGVEQGEWEYGPAGFVLQAGQAPNGRVFEASFDLAASHLKRQPGQVFGVELAYYDYAFGAWVPLVLWPGLSATVEPRRMARVTLGLRDLFSAEPRVLDFAAEEGGPPTAAQPLELGTEGGASAGFRLEPSADWLRASAPAGITPAALEVWADPSGLAPGEHAAVLTLRGEGAAAYFPELAIPVSLVVAPACPDRDGDGHLDAACGGDDCDDWHGAVSPGAAEICGDGVDQDCDGLDPACPCPDADGDGHQDSACGGDDCDDGAAAVHPGAEEICGDGIDQDCNGFDIECACTTDADGDGHMALTCPDGDDCDDADPDVHPGAEDPCEDGLDQDCDGQDRICPCRDADQDGHQAADCGGDDCDDGDAGAHPGADELCGDGLDQDCSGADLECEPEPEDGGGGCATGGGAGGLALLGLLLGLACLRRSRC
ncbi:MAG TPA: C25 family cysteine peptidase [Myxococcota bacterium]|nr:C25 family cysteine peptidase [Myxococcota bacterium]HRY92989.1 C25 family cysteine peptidase [Myxococcota bacterium]HSA19901.1 C25 family cysteine peptidase [Myxococcota bacterium]